MWTQHLHIYGNIYEKFQEYFLVEVVKWAPTIRRWYFKMHYQMLGVFLIKSQKQTNWTHTETMLCFSPGSLTQGSLKKICLRTEYYTPTQRFVFIKNKMPDTNFILFHSEGFTKKNISANKKTTLSPPEILHCCV